MRVIIDRFEGDYAVCERPDRKTVNIRKDRPPPDAREGDILVIEADGTRLDRDETTQREKRIDSLMKDLWE